MTVAEAHRHLSRPLKCGDLEQVAARKLLEELAEAIEGLPMAPLDRALHTDDELVRKWRTYKYLMGS